MTSLINTIPYRPQSVAVPQSAQAASQDANVFKKDFQKYLYVPAKPLSPGHTAPKGIKPLSPKGYLVKENWLQSAGSTVNSYVDYVKYFYKAAFKGEGTDYSVGKINDLAIRTGSLGIAAVLASSKVFPFAKGMEFVGLGTWFASMAIWPKLIGTVIKAGTGVDINQKYVDSYGRRKNFNEDPQYMVWDLFRHIDKNGNFNKNAPDFEKFDLIGDKLGVPRNIKNRREAIQDKYRQVAIQGNAISMLTAGVMTPVISSVVADKLQDPFKNMLSHIRIDNSHKKAVELSNKVNQIIDAKTTDIGTVMQQLGIKIDPKVSAKFNALLEGANDKVSQDGYKKFKKFIIERYFGTGIQTAIMDEMEIAMNSSERMVAVDDNFAKQLMKITKDAVNDVVEMVPAEFRDKIPASFKNFNGLKREEIDAAFKESGIPMGQNQANIAEQASIKNLLGRKVAWDIKESREQIPEELIEEVQNVINTKVKAYYEKHGYNSLNTEKIKKIFNFAETNLELKNRLRQIEEATIMNISESATAMNWERLPQKYFKALGFSKAELNEIAATGSKRAAELITKRFEQIVSSKDPNEFNKVVTEMTKLAAGAVSKEEKAMIELIRTADTPGVIATVRKLMNHVVQHNEFSHGMINGINRMYYENTRRIGEKFSNTMDSFFRPIRALDVFKNIDETVKNILGADVKAFREKLKDSKYYTFVTPRPTGMSEEVFYEREYARAVSGLKKYIKDIVLQKNDTNNWMTKMEVAIPGYKKGINHSLGMLWEIADIANGPITEGTRRAVVDTINGKVTQQAAQGIIEKAQQETSLVNHFIDLANKNVERLKFGFMGMENKIWEHSNVYDTINKGLVEKLFKDKDTSVAPQIIEMLKARVADLGHDLVNKCVDDVENFVRTRCVENPQGHYDADSMIPYIRSKIDCKVANTSLTKRSGKHVADFISGAAENLASRNKWTKTAYGFLAGTTALTLLALAFVGRKNYFNKDQYEKLN